MTIIPGGETVDTEPIRLETPYYYYQYYQQSLNPTGQPQNTVMSKDLMMKLMNLTLYQQTGLAMKLVRIANEIYTGMNLDIQG